jgi:hypothetical protein
MESLARLVVLIVLGRIAFVALCVALVITALDHRFVDGFLQTRPGLPSSPFWWVGLVVAAAGLVLAMASRLR